MEQPQVMLVEDERIVAMNLRQQLLKLGYRVPAVAASGADALRQIEAFRPDVILMDIHIEGDMDGISTAAAIPGEYQIPVIYLTAYSEEATLALARTTKPYGYLIKPFSERELHATIQMTLERRNVELELRRAKQDLEKIVEERSRALDQRDILIREVYHRVKNNLQLVDSIMNMQARMIEDPQARQVLFGLRGRILALGLVHQQLMNSADLKNFDIAPFLEELSKNILDSVGKSGVNLTLEACTLKVGLDFAVPLGLLATELITNSLKHAFPDRGGTISVLLQNDTDGKLVLTVSDDGIGAPDSGELRVGLGSRIIGNLVRQLEGTLTARNEGGIKTEVRMAMPIPS
jgi:two-component sensor histidine kinase/CheY-like chemotaxis protein